MISLELQKKLNISKLGIKNKLLLLNASYTMGYLLGAYMKPCIFYKETFAEALTSVFNDAVFSLQTHNIEQLASGVIVGNVFELRCFMIGWVVIRGYPEDERSMKLLNRFVIRHIDFSTNSIELEDSK